MSKPSYDAFFERLTGHAPLPWQRRLAMSPERPDALALPTGLGKTAGVAVDWLYRRLTGGSAGMRLVICLPMRTLVEQTRDSLATWLRQAAPQFTERNLPLPGLHLLLGGEIDAAWVQRPESPAVLVGTQDLLLSRALLRGYGMNAFQWPVQCGLLHNDAEWVFDEIQLMGPGLVTAAQLEAFRRRLGTARPCRSLWVSATLRADWLATVDLAPLLPAPRVLTLDETDRAHPLVQRREGAIKRLHAAPLTLSAIKKAELRAELETLAEAVAAAHRPGTQTIVFLNTVARAQLLLALLQSRVEHPPLLIHSRFRPAERAALTASLGETPPPAGRVLVTTQAFEAGVDISSRTLFTEIAPWASLVQRFGRCNRYGECAEGADIHWIDLGEELSAPYVRPELDEARRQLAGLSSAAPADLPAVGARPESGATLRQRDLLALFDTDPDLSGFDLDISGYIRDTDSADAFVFWRTDLERAELGNIEPRRDELCRVPLAGLRELLKRKDVEHGWTWDRIDGEWRRLPAGLLAQRLRPGLTLLLDGTAGGYTPDTGFDPGSKDPVGEIVPPSDPPLPEGHGDDPASRQGQPVLLGEHLADVEHASRTLATACDPEAVERLATAARWHDAGKSHPVFQETMHAAGEAPPGLLAKSTGRARHARKGFRHELVSALLWLEQHPEHAERDLVAYLVAAHHGRVRMSLRALPDEPAPPGGGLYARGVWEGDRTPAFAIGDEMLPERELRLDLMQLGSGPQGASWRQRTETLLAEHGPFRLAWWEALLRIADWRASATEAAGELKETHA
jgi:CRISPR-associated endonuclease/helicase Cas3